MAMPKSANGPTFKAADAEWLSFPWVPSKLNNVGPRFAAFAAVNVTDIVDPTAIENGDAGDDVTPDGNPVIATLTFPVKPLTAFADTLTGMLLP